MVVGTLKQFNVDEPMFIEERKSYQKRYKKLLSTYIAIGNLYERVINHNDEIFRINNIDVKWNQFTDLLIKNTHTDFMNSRLKELHDNLDDNILEDSDYVKESLNEIINRYTGLLDAFPSILSNIIIKNSSDLMDNGQNILRSKFNIDVKIGNYALCTKSNLFYNDIFIITNPKKNIVERILDNIPNPDHVLIICIHDGENEDLLRLNNALDIDTSKLLNHSIRKPKIILMKPTLTYTTFRKLMDIITLSN